MFNACSDRGRLNFSSRSRAMIASDSLSIWRVVSIYESSHPARDQLNLSFNHASTFAHPGLIGIARLMTMLAPGTGLSFVSVMVFHLQFLKCPLPFL